LKERSGLTRGLPIGGRGLVLNIILCIRNIAKDGRRPVKQQMATIPFIKQISGHLLLETIDCIFFKRLPLPE